MRIIDAEDCARVCRSIVKNAKKELVFLSPNCNIPPELLEKCEAENILIVYRKKAKGGSDMKKSVVEKLMDTIKKLRSEGKEVTFRGRENLDTKCLLNENKAILGSVAFEYEPEYSSIPEIMDDEGEFRPNPNFDVDAYSKIRFSMSVLVEPAENNPTDTKIYREMRLCIDELFSYSYVEEPWYVYKYITRKLNKDLQPEIELHAMDYNVPKWIEERRKFFEERYGPGLY